MGKLLGESDLIPATAEGKLADHELGIDPATIATGGVKLITGIFGGGRKAKRRARDQLMNSMVGLGVNRSVLDPGFESDQVDRGKKLLQFLQSNPKAISLANQRGKIWIDNEHPGDMEAFIGEATRELERQRQQQQAASSGSNLPAGMIPSGIKLSPALKYTLYGVGALGVGAAAYAGFSKIIE